MKNTVKDFRKMKERGEKIVMLTAYDSPTAKLAEECGMDALLVGDSLAMTMLGYENTVSLTLEQSLHHSAAVRRGARDSFIIGDMPFMTFHTSIPDALKNAARYLQEAGLDAVKIEGGCEQVPLVERLTAAGVPVMGHIGLLPQRVLVSGGYRIAGRSDAEAESLISDAVELEKAGIFALVLEGIPAGLSARISEKVSIPTIGIGAGINCDGQIQVVSDILGVSDSFLPKHAKRYTSLAEIIRKAIGEYRDDVRNQKFPGAENSFQ